MKTLISSFIAIAYCFAIATLVYMSAGSALTEEPSPATVADTQSVSSPS